MSGSNELTIQCVGLVPDHSVDPETGNPFSGYESKSYYPGDVIGVHPRITESPNPNGRLIFLHITDAPDSVTASILNKILTEPLIDHSDIVVEGDVIDTESRVLRRKWKVDPAMITSAGRSELLANKEITRDWTYVSSLYWTANLTTQLKDIV